MRPSPDENTHVREVPRALRIFSRRRITPSRVRAILTHAFNITGTEFRRWTGWSFGEYCKANATWTERQFADLVAENRETIQGGEPEGQRP